MKREMTEQEIFWKGDFGNEYSKRNTGDSLFACNLMLFSKILHRTTGIKSVLEFGANIGVNLMAIKSLLPETELSAIEINDSAAASLKKCGEIKNIYPQSILDFKPDYCRDLVLIKTVLIHINPEKLNEVYKLLYKSSGKYICIAEYYSPKPVTLMYRGNENKLFKRDFAGEIMEKYSDLKLVDYGFAYHRDNNYKEYDDINWFLLEKRDK